jgi:ligand-binding sensor domain-containing protein/signal transduction histidine kinase
MMRTAGVNLTRLRRGASLVMLPESRRARVRPPPDFARADMPKHRWIYACLWLCFLRWCSLVLAAGQAPAQPGGRYLVDVWENDDGLPQSSIIAMTQTRDGYLWLGTVNGLVRFDGKRFTVFDEDTTPGLGGSPIVSLFEDTRDNLWIGSEGAGVILVGKGGSVTNLGIGRGSRELRISEDASGAVWVCMADGPLWRCRDGATNSFRSSTGYRWVMAEKSGKLWAMAEGQMIEVQTDGDFSRGVLPAQRRGPVENLDWLLASRNGGHWRLANGRIGKWTGDTLDRDFGSNHWSYARVSAACEDREGNLVVGTLGEGVFVYHLAGGVSSISTNEGLSGNLILSLALDREGTLWVGTDGAGLNRVKPRHFQVVEQTRGVTVRSVCEDGQGGLWMSFNAVELNANGAGYVKDGVFRGYGRTEGLFNSSVWSVFVDRKGQVWAGTYGGLFQFINGRFHGIGTVEAGWPRILAIHEDRQGQLWLGAQAGLVRWAGRDSKVFGRRDGLSAEEVLAMADDSEGNLWIGARGGGLNRLLAGKFTSFHRPDALPAADISSLYVDADGVLWVGTLGGGLARFHRGKWTRYTTREGLVSKSIGYLVEDTQGYLWIGSNQGLMRVKKQALNDCASGALASLPVRVFGQPDGLPTVECILGSQPGACRTRDGRLWFPTIKGLAHVDPARIVSNTNPPPVVIESVLVDGAVRSASGLRARPPQRIVMSPQDERLEIQYTSLNLSASDRARFKHRLEGHETAWAEVGNLRIASYSRLPPGEYRFQVTACNEDGVWNEMGAEVTLVVEPHYWQTRWFLGLVGAAVLGLVAGAVYYVSTQKLQRQLAGLRQQEALEQERSRIARDIHDQLGANLTQVSLLGELVESDKDQPDEVAAHAKQISQTALETSRALDEIVWTVNPRNDTLDGLVNYICKYAQDYLAVAGLRYRLDVPAQLPNAPISPEVRHNVFLASKEAITNVVRHAQASSAWLRLRLEPGRFTIEIQDDGRGPAGTREERAQTRNGLRNMGRRMEDVGGSFEIGPAPERGTLVRLTAPFKCQ